MSVRTGQPVLTGWNQVSRSWHLFYPGNVNSLVLFVVGVAVLVAAN